MEKKLLAKYERMLKDSLINSWMAGYKTSSRYNYLGGLERFLKYVEMTPAQLIARCMPLPSPPILWQSPIEQGNSPETGLNAFGG